MTFLHGISVVETAGAPRGLTPIATAVIGLVATATAPAGAATTALNAAFPLNRPTLVSDLPGAIEAAGTGGTLKGALQAIAAQVRAPVIVVRIAAGADTAATNTAVIGADTNGVKTGMQALLAAQAQTGHRPRILGAPGLDTQPVTAAFVTLARRLRAMVYARAIGTNLAELTAYRGQFADARELMLLHPDFLDEGGATSLAVGHALGLRAAIDATQGWHKTISNVPLAGVTGLTADVEFDYQDVDATANLLNNAHVTTAVRLDGSLRFWGNRTCAAANSDFVFESATRTAHVLADTMATGLVPFLDRPLTPGLARDIVEEINELFRKLVRAGQLLGAMAWFDGAQNPADELRQGRLKLRYRYTPVPPLEGLSLSQEITDEFLADFATLVAAAR